MIAPAALRPYCSLLRPSLEQRGEPYTVYPSLGRPRWLVPAGPSRRRTGMGFASGGVLHEIARGALIASGILRGDPIWLDVAPLAKALARVLGEPVGALAFYVGTDGAYRKLTVRISARDGAVSAYAKIAGHGLAHQAVEHEHAMLLRLARVPGLRGRVPEVLGWVSWNDLRALVLSAGPSRCGPRRLTTQHVEFLRSLCDATRVEVSFRESAMWARIVATVGRLSSRMPAPWPDRYARALDRLDGCLGRTVLSLGLAHRDFAPWNTTRDARGLFVFDWEAAAEETIPLYDVFHFRAIQAARTRRRMAILPRATDVRDLFGPAARVSPEVLLGAYLIDMSLFYTEARVLAPHAGEDSVWRWLGGQLDAWAEGRYGVA